MHILVSQFMAKLSNAEYNKVCKWYKNISCILSIKTNLTITNMQARMIDQDLLLAYINHGNYHWTLFQKYLLFQCRISYRCWT